MPVINEKIADLLIRHLEGELNLHEQAQLREWLDDSPLHEQIAKEFMEEENLQANLSALVSKEKSWEKFLQSVPLTQRVQSDPQVIKLKSLRKLFGWTAAAASVVLLVSVAIYFFNANRESASFVMEHTQGNNDIEPGHDGAILTLADGSQIVLDSVANGVIALQNGSQVVLENGRLTYGTAGKAADEIVYNTVTTPKGRQFSLLLPDGTRVWLNAESSIRYPTAFAGNERRLEMQGEAYFEVAKDPKMPFRTTSSPTTPNPQLSDTEELFAKIWEDLEAALADIPTIVGSPIWANKSALHAIRAQYFMYKRDWPNMLKEANDSWVAAGGDASKLIYDFNDFRYRVVGTPPVDGTDHAVSLSIEYAPNGVVNTSEPFSEARGRENLFWRRAASSSGIYPSDSYKALFDKDNDLRYKLFMLKGNGATFAGGFNDGIQEMWYRANKLTRSHGITYPEVLLMRAEANARTNKLTEALTDLNLLRRYRYVRASGDPITVTDLPGGSGLNQDQLLNEILKERRREMPYNSFHRTVDIKRYFHDTGKPWSQTSLTHTIGPKTFTVTLNKHSFTLPLTNEILKYNPHWGIPLTDGLWNPFVQ